MNSCIKDYVIIVMGVSNIFLPQIYFGSNDYIHRGPQVVVLTLWTRAALNQPVQCWLSWGIGMESKWSPTMLDFRQRYLTPSCSLKFHTSNPPMQLNFYSRRCTTTSSRV